MKAIVYKEYGPPQVLHLTDIAKPVPKKNEVLIRVHASSVNYGDLLARNFKEVTPKKFNMPFLFWVMSKIYFGITKPKIEIPGSEFAGVIESTGTKVTQFKAGDQVFGYPGQSMGAYAEYLCMPETGTLALKPANMTFEEAAVIPMGAIMALHLLKQVQVRQGQKVLINGASGSIGSAAVQIAKHFNAEVTGVCGTPRLNYVKALGADEVIDYSQEDFTKNGRVYDLIFDILGKSSFSRCKGSLSPKGTYLRASFKMRQILQMIWTSITGGRRVRCILAPGGPGDLREIKTLIEGGKIKSIIDKSYPLAKAADAHRYAEEGQARGKVAIAIGEK